MSSAGRLTPGPVGTVVDMHTCHECSSPAVRTLARRGYCAVHLELLYATFSPKVFDGYNGHGMQRGVQRPEFGPLAAELECTTCSASWVGVPGEACVWCERAYRTTVEHQAELVLVAPDVDVADERRQGALVAWSARLGVAVDAGLIDEALAARVLAREVARAA